MHPFIWQIFIESIIVVRKSPRHWDSEMNKIYVIAYGDYILVGDTDRWLKIITSKMSHIDEFCEDQ